MEAGPLHMSPAHRRLALAAVIAVGVALRSVAIGRCLWFDEAVSFRLSEFRWGEIAGRVGGDTHSPLFFWILKAWTLLAGTSAPALRALSVACAAVTMGAVYGLCREGLGRKNTSGAGGPGGPGGAGGLGDERDDGAAAGLLGAWLVALDFQQIAWGSEVRMYALMTALWALSGWALLWALRPGAAAPWRWLVYGVSALAASIVHYYGLFLLLAQGLFALAVLLARGRRGEGPPLLRALAGAALAPAVVLLGWLPWLPTLMSQRAAVGAGWFQRHLGLEGAARAFAALLGPQPAVLPGAALVAAVALLGLGLGLALRRGPAAARLAALSALVPWGGGVAAALLGPAAVLLDRYLLGAQVYAFVALAALAARPPSPRRRRALLLGAAAAAALIASLRAPLLHPTARRDLRAAVAHLREARRPGEPVLIDMGVYLPMIYHAREQAVEHAPALAPDRGEERAAPGGGPAGAPEGWRVYLNDGAPVWRGGAVLTPADGRLGGGLGALGGGRVFVVQIGAGAVPVPPRWIRREARHFQQAFPAGWSNSPARLIPVQVIRYDAPPP